MKAARRIGDQNERRTSAPREVTRSSDTPRRHRARDGTRDLCVLCGCWEQHAVGLAGKRSHRVGQAGALTRPIALYVADIASILWHSTNPDEEDGHHMAVPDVAVVGGGLIGLLTAAELAERGAHVLVVEKDDVGFEQSGRSVAAINLPGGAPNRSSAAMLAASADEWATFEDRWQCVVDLNSEGWHIVIADEEDQAWLDTERSTWHQTAGYPDTEMLDSAAARLRFPQLEGQFLALDVRHGGHVDAVMVMKGLREAAVRLGIDIRSGINVTGFEQKGEAVTAVRTSRGPVACGAVIVAAGVWSPQLCDTVGFHIPMQRVRAPAAETGPLPSKVIPGFLRAASFGARQNRNGMVRITGGYRFSAMLHDIAFSDLRDLRIWAPALWQNRKDVSLRLSPSALGMELGCRLERLRGRGECIVPRGYHPPSKPRLRRKQLEALGRLIPAVRGARIQRAFAGVIDLTPDLQPVVGPIPGTENAYVSTGFSGHGYMYGPGACQALASLIVSGESAIDLSPYRPERLNEDLAMRAQIF
jgi:glycine/D-amino acid oxidase-like deaminating enzyme